jgi:hypothetical protein
MPTARSKTITAAFTRERETPGTQRFAEDGDKGEKVVGYIYVKKAADKKLGSPERVQVTITPLP